MKKIVVLILSLAVSLAQAQDTANTFNNRLENIFEQSTLHTDSRQIVFLTLEASVAFPMNLLISSKGRKLIKDISRAKKYTNNTLRYLIRGTQTFLILDIGSRIYVLAYLEKDPGVIPLRTIICSELDCPQQIDDFLNISNKVFEANTPQETRETQ